MPLVTGPWGADNLLRDGTRYRPELWQYQPTSTAHDPNPPLPLEAAAGGFPTQYSGLKGRKSAATIDLCLVLEADGATGMGGIPKLLKGGVEYAVYLVETTDPNASPFRIRTTTGTKAIRLKT